MYLPRFGGVSFIGWSLCLIPIITLYLLSLLHLPFCYLGGFDMRIFIRIFIVLNFISVVQNAIAADYSWQVNGYTSLGTFLSPSNACESYRTHIESTDSRYTITVKSLYKYTDTIFKCVLNSVNKTTGATLDYPPRDIIRSGTSCPSGFVYDSVTGSCKGNQCESIAGQKETFEYSYSQHDSDGNPSPDPPPYCKDGCQYTNDFGTFTVKRDPANPDSFIGNFNYSGNGLSCTSSTDPSVFDQPPAKPPFDEQPKYNQENNCGDWVANPDGTMSRSCFSKTEYDKPGPVNCIGSNCTSGTPPAEYNKTDVTENTDKTTNPDGSTQTEVTTTKDNVNCKGTKPCTGTTSQTTQTSGTNPDGSPGNTSTDCTGTGCKDESNTGEEEGAEEEEEPVSSVTGGDICEVPPSCEGDAVQCAILKQQFEARCDFEEAADFEGSKTDIEGLFEGEQFELETVDIQAPSFINSGSRFLPSGCPPPQQISLSSNGGHTYSLKFDPLCSFASDFSYLIMAMMSIWCAVYVGRSFGGE